MKIVENPKEATFPSGRKKNSCRMRNDQLFPVGMPQCLTFAGGSFLAGVVRALIATTPWRTSFFFV